MVTLLEAYRIIKEYTNVPIMSLLERDDSYWGVTEGYIGVNKRTGNIKQLSAAWEYVISIKNDKYVATEELYEDFLEYYKHHSDERNLAMLYTRAWNQMFIHRDARKESYKCESDRNAMIDKWSEIEHILYHDIRNIIDNEEIDYPPCVLEKFDDPFYRIKPFMQRNGFTDDNRYKIWVPV